ncbi:MAG TPA: DUF2510 domain-containing protein [Ilumatobacteraceae bacterium]|nr:DUF2510 domain-containing protein [Ilumatobacteraceae bacterium]
MTAPTSPPLMPPPGWYPDPEQAWTWRWWDGSRWTDLRAPQSGWLPHRDPHSFSAWFEDSFAAFKAVTRRAGWLIALVWIVATALIGIFVVAVYNSSKGREIRELVDFDQAFGSDSTVLLTDAELDRVGELARDILIAASPWMIVLAIVLVITWTFATALAARVAARVGSGTVDQVGRADDAADAVRRAPVVFVSLLALAGISLGMVLAAFAPMLLAIGVGGGGGVVAVAGVFGLLAAFAATFWIFGRLSLAPAIAAIGDHGIGVRRSWELTDGHFWGVVGRLVIASLIAGAATFPFSFFNSFGVAFGFSAWLTLVLLLQAASSVIATLVNIPAQVVLVEHLTEQRT